jgi:hypothetical protein
MDAGAFEQESRDIETLITDLVLTRMVAVRRTDPELADQYERIALHGAVNPGLYAAVLRFAGEARGLRRRDGRRADLPDAA